jgi:CBS domain-containing protein
MAAIEPEDKEKQRESGLPGGGAGRRDEVGGSGVYPMSGPHPSGDAPIVSEPCWGQGSRGVAGYDDHGDSELTIERVTPEKCREVMTKDPVCCLPSDSGQKVAQLMMEHDVGIIPVVETEPGKRLLGVVTDRDLTLKIVCEGREPGTRVEELMTLPVLSCSPDDDYQQALEVMELRQIRRIPALDESGRVVGMIAQADIALRIRDKSKTAEVVEQISKPAVSRGGGGAIC